MNNKNGFTLIELLAVIIILGILIIIAIPSVTKYISDSRKSAYIDTVKEIIGSARNLVNSGELEMYDTDVTYYISYDCIKTENSMKSPYGDFKKAYVVVTYDGNGYKYYWTSIDETGQGIKKITRLDKLNIDLIESNLNESDIPSSLGVGGRNKFMIIDKDSTGCNYGVKNDVTGQEASNERRIENVGFDQIWPSQIHLIGDTVTLRAKTDGYDGYNYRFEWFYQVTKDGEKILIKGENERDFVVTVTISNFAYWWSVDLIIIDD